MSKRIIWEIYAIGAMLMCMWFTFSGDWPKAIAPWLCSIVFGLIAGHCEQDEKL